MIISLLGFSYLAFGLLALAMFSHYRDTFGSAPSPTQAKVLYIAGWLAIGGTYWGCIANLGTAYGSILFFGLLSFSGLLVILMLSYRAKLLPYSMALSTLFSSILVGLN
ncbi:DUF3325 domain-containing protein [Shewanella sp. MBTL60-007]|uniref:DUF3325 domain-containing protein n=1 Tax=Shewanella sp. MBTL60-007 TaxID=2815911 RepID=UPI001BBD557E|nr:DUF3325 domain-containing protein [Shewanella sp. MBTL60-007]GIU18392.1 hypothetical protein TUM3792_14490 [Shewanella sp. MBTL60-007]